MSELETVQKKEALSLVDRANNSPINNDESYSAAAEFLKSIKELSKRVTEYWEPLKKSAHASWKAICDRENAITRPISEAEAIVKNKMLTFQREKEVKARAAAAEAERLKKEASEQLLKEAAEAEESGDTFSSEMLLVQAEIVRDIAPIATVTSNKVDGISTRKVWKAMVTNEGNVPISIAGIILRPVDQKALDNLAKTSKGKMQIPGVEFYEESVLSARTR